jgi:hypothetical protein
VLQRYKHDRPIVGAKVCFSGDDRVVQADENGYFRLEKWWLMAQNTPIRVTAPGVELTVALDLKDSLTSHLFIHVSKGKKASACCLNESERRENRAGVVVLIHGFGVDFGSFSLSGKENTWKSAHDLFVTDPEFRDFDFYMLDHWDDDSLVQSCRELARFLAMIRHTYGPEPRIILLGHSAGGLIIRHYSVSRFYIPGTVERFMMMATPNDGSLLSILHFESKGVRFREPDGKGAASYEIFKSSDYLKCLNNKSDSGLDCYELFGIDKNLQDYRGLNPDVPRTIVAGEVKAHLNTQFDRAGNRMEDLFNNWLGEEAGNWVKKSMNKINNGILERIPDGDLIVSLKSQLMPDVPFTFLPYPHGYIHRPKGRDDARYQTMKRFILDGGNMNDV